MQLQVEKALVTQVEELARMNRQLIIDEGHSNPMNLEQLTGRMRDWLEGGDYSAYLALADGVIAGYCLYRDEGTHIYIRHLFVQVSFRRHGVGKTLVNWLHENLWMGRKLRLDVLCGNQNGLQFWRRISFADYAITLER